MKSVYTGALSKTANLGTGEEMKENKTPYCHRYVLVPGVHVTDLRHRFALPLTLILVFVFVLYLIEC